jgi:hypothetical protein
MFKATHKRRVTTLSKTLLTAGLLGGAALSTLGAGSAQAAWSPDPEVTDPSNSYACTFGGAVLCEVGDPTGTVGAPPNPSDKIFTLLNSNSILPDSTLVFSYISGPDIHPWHVDLDMGGSPTVQDFDGGFLGYTLEVTDPNSALISAYLAAQAPAGSVTKDIYSSAALYNAGSGGPGDICQLTVLGTQCDFSGVSQIWVRDTWIATPAGVDNLSNDFSQVPAPLPLLGVAATFGSIRKLRKFSSQLKTFSMG